MKKIQNMTIFHFGESTKMMFNVIMGVSKLNLDKGILFLDSRLGLSSNKKMTTIDIKNISNQAKSFKDYSVVIIDNDINQDILNYINKEDNSEVAFIVCTKSKENVSEEEYVVIDFEELDTLPMFKKVLKVNDIRKKLKANKVLKKFKFFS